MNLLFSSFKGIRDDLELLLEEDLSSINLCALHCELRNTEQLLSSLGLILLFAVEKDNIQVPSFSGTFYLVSFLSYCFHSLYPLQGFYFCAVAAT